MNVVLDGLLLFLNNGQVGDYSRSIVDNLIKYSNINLEIIKDYELVSKIYKNHVVDLLLDRKSNDYSNLSFFLKSRKNSIYHCLNNGFSIPKNFEFNYIMSINNLLPIYYEDLCLESYVSNFFSKMPYGVLNSSYIVCPSVSSKENFLQSFSLDEEKVFVNYGVISNFYNKVDKFLSNIYIKSKFNIEDEFIVFSGDFHPRKNLENCILLLTKLKYHIPKLKFLIVSYSFSDWIYMDKLKDLSKKLNVYNDIIFLENISVIDKVNIFSKALFFIDLSIYEDVNLGIVEAFSCKTPIVCSDISLYKEYFGDFVFYYSDDLDVFTILDFVYKYIYPDNNFILNKFNRDISLISSLNVYSKFKLDT